MKPSQSRSSSTHSVASWRTRLPFFYGWVVVGSAFAVQAISFGVYYTFSVFFVAMLEEFNWSRAATAGVFSLFLVSKALFGVPAGALVDRFGPRRVVPVGAVVASLGLVGASRVSELWEYYLYFGVVCALGLALSSWVPAVVVVSRWFVAKQGTALGIIGAGIGLGIVVWVPLCQYLISTYGWRPAYLVMALVVLLGIGPQVVALQVSRPEDLGLRPDGSTGEETSTPAMAKLPRRFVVVDQKWASTLWTVGRAARTARFWLLFANFSLCILTNQMLWVHQVAYLVDGGYDKMVAATAAGVAGFVSMPGKILWGALSDRAGRELAYTAGISAMMLGILLLVLAPAFPSWWLILLFAVTFALGYAAGAPIGPAATGDIFAGRHFGAIYGFVSIGSGLGGAVGAWLAGYVFDLTGSYLVAFGIAAACSAVSVACLWLAAPRRVRRVALGGGRSEP